MTDLYYRSQIEQSTDNFPPTSRSPATTALLNSDDTLDLTNVPIGAGNFATDSLGSSMTQIPFIPLAKVQNSSIDSEFQNFQDLQFINEPGTLHSSEGLGRPRKANPMGPELTNEQLKSRMPSLRDPNAERGPPRLSMTEWLASGAKAKPLSHTISGIITAQETSSQADLPAVATISPAQSSAPIQLATRTIIPDAEDGSVINSEVEIDAENDAIGVEDFYESQTEFNDQDPGLTNLEDEKSSAGTNTGPKRQSMPIPEWFTKALDVKLALIQQRDSNGKFTFYTQHQNFWVPQKAKWRSEEHTSELQSPA